MLMVTQSSGEVKRLLDRRLVNGWQTLDPAHCGHRRTPGKSAGAAKKP